MFLLPQPVLASEPLRRLPRFQRRTRLINITFGLILSLSLVANFHQWTRFHRLKEPLPFTSRVASLALNSNNAVKNATNLVVVAGHSIWRVSIQAVLFSLRSRPIASGFLMLRALIASTL